MTFVIRDAGVIGEPPGIESADSKDNKIEFLHRVLPLIQVVYRQMPLRIRIAPCGIGDAMAEFQVTVDVMLPRSRLPIIADLCALGKLFRPLRVGGEGGLVDMGWYVASHCDHLLVCRSAAYGQGAYLRDMYFQAMSRSPLRSSRRW